VNCLDDVPEKEREKSWGAAGGGVCPKPFKIPSKEELEKEMTKSNITNANAAFSSFLKIPSAGYRTNRGNIPKNHPAVLLWTRSPASAVRGGDIDAYYFTASINNNDAGFHTIERSYGLSIRCISIHGPIPPSD
jgi:hypothetical protein